jgi:hypothetical protein
MTAARYGRFFFPFLLMFMFMAAQSFAQGDASVSARIDAKQLTVGDQAQLFIEARHNTLQSKLQWAVLPDTFNNLEIVEKGKIDTVKQGDVAIYKQRLLVTGFDSGSFKIPAFLFSVIPNQGHAYTLQTDSFQLLVNTVAVDTTKGIRPIKGILNVPSSWRDYIWYIVGGAILLLLIIAAVIYFAKRKKTPAPPPPPPPAVPLHEQYLKLLAEVDHKQLWQQGRVKEYYVDLTDVLREYVEKRFNTQALELTTDELLDIARRHRELAVHHDLLANILRTADLAKFAKAQPLPAEHVAALEAARNFIETTKPVATEPKTN